MKFATQLLSFEAAPGDPAQPVSTPIHQTATFEQSSALEPGAYDYSRSGNPTRSVLETLMAKLEGATRSFAYASGLAALGSLVHLVPAGGTIVASDDIYGGTYRLLSELFAPLGIRILFTDLTDERATAAALAEGAALVLAETPTNPLLRICDLRRLARQAHAAGARLAVDSSFLSPYLIRPLELGADIAWQSATKFLSGHSDLTAGVVSVRDPDLVERLAFLQNAAGTALDPFQSWLLLRGLKTLSIRVDRQQASAARLAAFLYTAKEIHGVRYPGLVGHPGRAVHERQADGPGSVICFETGSVEASRRLVESLRLFTVAVSFGSVGSTVSLPCRMSHASVPFAVRRARALPEDLVRLSIGIEDPDDLLTDLAGGIDAMANPQRQASKALP
jgi:cystathionine beta-lyase